MRISEVDQSLRKWPLSCFLWHLSLGKWENMSFKNVFNYRLCSREDNTFDSVCLFVYVSVCTFTTNYHYQHAPRQLENHINMYGRTDGHYQTYYFPCPAVINKTWTIFSILNPYHIFCTQTKFTPSSVNSRIRQ